MDTGLVRRTRGRCPDRLEDRAGGRTVFAALFLVLWAHGSAAEVARIEVLSRSVLAGGKVFGAAGAYEKITGRLHYAVDPGNPANARIVDLGLAPRDRAGRAQNPWFSVHLTWFSTEVDFSSCDVRFGSLADLSACPKRTLAPALRMVCCAG